MAVEIVRRYTCDHPDCDVSDFGVMEGKVRSRRTPEGLHWCLDHYPYATCPHCGHILRPAGAKQRLWPRTRARGARGLCSACYHHERAYGKLPNRKRLTTTREVRRVGGTSYHEGEGDWQLGEPQ